MDGNRPQGAAAPPWVGVGKRGVRYDKRDLDEWIADHKEWPKDGGAADCN